MTDHATRIAALSPEKRELLLQKFKEKQTAIAQSSSALPQIAPNPEQRYLPFPLTDVQRAHWIGRSGLFDLSTCTNIYLEYEIAFQFPAEKRVLNWRSLLGWLGRTFGRKHLENKLIAFFTDRLNIALQRLIERHDMLRAIVLPDGRQQILSRVSPYRVKVMDLRGQPSHRTEADLAKARERLLDTKTPIDQWPLFEFLVCPLDGHRIRLLVGVDPLIIDGDSRQNLTRELSQLLMNPQSFLPPMECTYRDYALAWADFQKSELYQRSRDYWLSRLPTMPPAPELPQLRNIDPLTPSRFKSLDLELLDPQTWQRLKDRAARIGLSPSAIAMAAFVEVLATWSLESRFTIGNIGTYHPPMHPQIMDVLGNFNNLTLLAVEDWPGSFEERARSLWKKLVADLDHRYFSGHQMLQEWKRKQGGSTRATIPIYFNSVIASSQPNYPARQRTTKRKTKTDKSSLYQLRMLEADSYFPQRLLVSIVYEPSDGMLSCRWLFVETIFAPSVVKDMLNAYHRFLQRLADDESSWHERARCLLPPEQLAQRAAFNATEASASCDMLHTLFASQVSKQPHQVAVVAGAQSLTYEALYRLANQVGLCLRELGARPNTLVAVVMESGWEQVVAVLGVLVSGAAYLPLDPRLPNEHLTRLLEHSEVKWILTQSRLDKSLNWPDSVLRFCIDDTDEWIDVEDGPLDLVQDPEDLACVIYTSAPSEQSKGVMITHQGVVNTILDINRRWSVGSQDRILALCPLSFDLSVYDIFGPLAAGGTIVIPEDSATLDAAQWAKSMCQHQITIWNSPPALLEMLVAYVVEHPDFTPCALRLALLSRDRISATLPHRLKTLLKSVQIIELSGTTETSVWSSFHLLEEADLASQRNFGGRPMTNQQLYVLDSLLELRPVWVPGQLYIGGIGLAQGYWKEEGETQTHFIQHPHTGERLYHTGELGRFLPNGTLEFLGPAKQFQAVVYGYRVELRQIEVVLEQHPAVRECIVVASKGTHRSNNLIAYIVPHLERPPTSEALRNFIKERLPDYMVPATFVMLDSMPLTFTGQIDRDALPIPADDNTKPQGDSIAPRNSLERQLVQIWESLLDTRPIRVTDNFFDLGGTSFLAVRLVNRIRDEFGVKQPLYTFLYDPTIEFLANVIRQ